MPRETVTIDVSGLPLYEAGATFLAWIAYPGSNEVRERRRFRLALCREFLNEQVNIDKAARKLIAIAADPKLSNREHVNVLLASRPLTYKLEYFTEIDGELAGRMIKGGFARLRDRHTAAHRLLMPFMVQANTGRDPRVGGFKLSVNNLATVALGDLDMAAGGRENIKHRVFKHSKPVMHAAAAIAFWQQNLNAQERAPKSFTVFDLLSYRDFLTASINLSELYRQKAIALVNPKISDHETISFVCG